MCSYIYADKHACTCPRVHVRMYAHLWDICVQVCILVVLWYHIQCTLLRCMTISALCLLAWLSVHLAWYMTFSTLYLATWSLVCVVLFMNNNLQLACKPICTRKSKTKPLSSRAPTQECFSLYSSCRQLPVMTQTLLIRRRTTTLQSWHTIWQLTLGDNFVWFPPPPVCVDTQPHSTPNLWSASWCSADSYATRLPPLHTSELGGIFWLKSFWYWSVGTSHGK